MTESQPKPLSIDDIRKIEARAHELRAQAMADMIIAFGRGLRAVPQRIFALVHRPRHA